MPRVLRPSGHSNLLYFTSGNGRMLYWLAPSYAPHRACESRYPDPGKLPKSPTPAPPSSARLCANPRNPPASASPAPAADPLAPPSEPGRSLRPPGAPSLPAAAWHYPQPAEALPWGSTADSSPQSNRMRHKRYAVRGSFCPSSSPYSPAASLTDCDTWRLPPSVSSLLCVVLTYYFQPGPPCIGVQPHATLGF